MAIKVYCDGCDKEITNAAYDKQAIDVLIYTVGGPRVSEIRYDLCKGCGERLKRQANPKEWAREKPKPMGANFDAPF